MKNYLSAQRLWLYLKADIYTNKRQYILLLGLVFALPMIMHYIDYLFTKNVTITTNGQITSQGINFESTYITIWVFLLAMITYVISTSFHNFYNKQFASANIMLPASNVEKFIYIFFKNFFIIPFLFIGLSWLTTQGWAWWFDIENRFIVFDLNFKFNVITYISLPMVLFFVGSIVFRKMQYLFSILSISALIAITSVIASYTQIDITLSWPIFILEILMIGYVFWRFNRLQITK